MGASKKRASSLLMVLLSMGSALLYACSAQAPDVANKRQPANFEEAIKDYSDYILKANSGRIVDASEPEKTTEMPSYVINYTVVDPALLTADISANDTAGYEANMAITDKWRSIFCTDKLKSIMDEYRVFMVTGQIVGNDGEKHSSSACMAD